jgi:hypothetical protein
MSFKVFLYHGDKACIVVNPEKCYAAGGPLKEG